ncbi:DUF461 domain-containing protein [Streptomyces hoynatensis]|uniref:DUF461 domain-containing protein n=1 Tax=Streptomyces hoynatensis TaxID=1141874 RepID=UPI00187ED99D|nr:DUF461 domain-containing protein [Streptomyces hoynatensis]
MSSSLRRGVAAAFFAFSIAGLTACGAGTDAATSEIKPDVASAQVDDIKVQNVSIVLPQGSSEDPGAVVGRVFNGSDRDQTLEAVQLPGSGSRVELGPAEGESDLVVPAHGSLALGGEGNASAVIADPQSGDIALGNAQRVVFVLSETGDIELRAQVVDDSDLLADFSEWGATPTPSTDEEAPAGEPQGSAEGTGEATAEGAGGATEGEGTEGTAGAEGTEGTAGTEGTEGPEGTEGSGQAEGASGEEATEGAGSTEGTESAQGTEGTANTEGAEGTEGEGASLDG